MKTHFKAPWDTSLKWSSALVTAMALIIAITGYPLDRYHFRFPDSWEPLFCRAMPVLALVGSALFIVRGFTIADGKLHVHRLFWVTQVDLHLLLSAEVNSEALRGGYRTCGNGGLYGYTGRYWSKTLGHYRAFVNDWKRPVVLRWPHKTIVLSCDDPEAFVSAVTPP